MREALRLPAAQRPLDSKLRGNQKELTPVFPARTVHSRCLQHYESSFCFLPQEQAGTPSRSIYEMLIVSCSVNPPVLYRHFCCPSSLLAAGLARPCGVQAEEGTEFLQFSCPLTELYSEIFEIPSSLLFWRVPLRKGEDGSIVLEGGQIISERKEL